MPNDLNSQLVGGALGKIFSEYVCVCGGGAVSAGVLCSSRYTFSPMVTITVTQRSRIDLQGGISDKTERKLISHLKEPNLGP